MATGHILKAVSMLNHFVEYTCVYPWLQFKIVHVFINEDLVTSLF